MKKSLLGSIFVAGIVLSGIAAQPQVQTHAAEDTAAAAATTQTEADSAATTPAASADSQTPVKSQVPSGQTIKTDGQNDTISTADADAKTDSNGDLAYKHVGNGGVVQVTEGYDDNGKEDGYYKATVSNQNAFKSDDTNDTSGYNTLGAASVFKGDTTYYAEYANGAWQANSLTMTDGQEPAGRQSFNVDVSSIAEDMDGSHFDQQLADGVSVSVSKSTHEDDGNHVFPGGTYFDVEIYGSNGFNDNYQTKSESDDEIAQMTDAYVNVPYTFHYFDTNNNLMTGTLNLINGKIETPATTTTTPDTDKGDTETPTTTPDTDKGDTETPVTTPDTDKGDTDTPATTPDTTKADTSTPATDTTDGKEPAKQPAGEPAPAKAPATTPAAAAQPATATPKATQLAAQPAAKAQTPAEPAATTPAKALPATGDQQTTLLAAFGTAMLALVGLTGLVSRKRRA